MSTDKTVDVLARILAVLLCLCMMLSTAGFTSLRDEDNGYAVEEQTPWEEGSVGDELPPPSDSDTGVAPVPSPDADTTLPPEDTGDVPPAADESGSDVPPAEDMDGDEEPAQVSETETPRFLGGTDLGDAQVARVMQWDLNGADAALRALYDEEFRIYASSAVSNQGSYFDNKPGGMLDDDDSTFWEPAWGDSDTNHSQVTFTFDSPVQISRIVYGCRLDAGYKGFANEFAIYASQTDEGEDFVLVATGSYEAVVSNLLEITFEEHTFKRLRFEFLRASGNYPSCRAMMFYGADDFDGVLDDLFADYARYVVNEPYNDPQELAALREMVQDHPKYESVYKPLLDRAEDIVSGRLVFNPAFELSTNPSAQNVIQRTGDVVSYARNTLRFTSSSTNRQVSGIAAYAGTTITVYVEAEENDPLPRIRFSQAYGYWASWLGGELQLARGVNTFTVPNFITSAYSKAVAAGGAIYIVNPYVPGQQSENVKIYIEGGDSYPVYRLGDDESAYIDALTAYADRVRANPTGVIDVTELVSNHVIMTVTATRADEIYDTKSPARNLETWDDIIEASMAFEGVQVDPGAAHYNYMNQYLNVNYRVSQNWPGGFMFAYTEHIGLYERGNGEDTLIYCLDDNGKPSIGWGHIHEYGHTVDLSGRVIGETTNNMVSNFLNTYFNGAIRNDNYIQIANNMSSDRTYTGSVYGTAFNSNRYNYMIYFLLESYRPGWWGDHNNIYRYNDPGYDYTGLNATEKHVFIASLAMGIDLGYYFERWGYQLSGSDPVFTRDGASDAYKTLVEQAVADGRLSTKVLPFWYLDSAQYMYMRNGGGGLYASDGSSDAPAVTRILPTSGGYSLTLPYVDDDAHLGYEIWEGSGDDWQIIGFTHTNSFTDATDYPDGYTPTYRVAAYDRRMNKTQLSDPVGLTAASGEDVCEVNDVAYATLAQAVAAAESGDVIYVLKDIEDSGVVVNKPLTIRPKDADVTIEKVGNEPIFTVTDGGKLTIEAADGHTLTLDGGRLYQSQPLVKAEGSAVLAMTGITLKNSVTTGSGGAIAVTSASVKGTLTNVTFADNKALNGGVIYNVGTITLTGCVLTGNSAGDCGGAVCNTSGGVITLADCQFTENSALKGGAVYLNGRTILTGGAVENNTATYGGALYVASNNDARHLEIGDGTVIRDNIAARGSFLFVENGGYVLINGGTVASAFRSDTAHAAVANVEPKYDIYTVAGQITIDGKKTDIQADIYKKGGTVTINNQLLPAGDLVFTLAVYTTAEPIICTNFTLEEKDLSAVTLAGGHDYDLEIGSDHQSVYLFSNNRVVFELYGGSINSGYMTTYIHGEITTLPTNVTKDGYIFLGWFADADYSGNSIKTIKPDESGDKVYYAKWAPIQSQTPAAPDAPDTDAPEPGVPKTDEPKTKEPDTKAPGTKVPDTDDPKTAPPATDAPGSDTPGNDDPEDHGAAEQPQIPPEPSTPPTPVPPVEEHPDLVPDARAGDGAVEDDQNTDTPTATPAPTADDRISPTFNPNATAGTETTHTAAPATAPDTGDGNNAALWAAMTALCLSGLSVALSRLRRKDRE